MNATELIVRLQELVLIHGNLEVFINNLHEDEDYELLDVNFKVAETLPKNWKRREEEFIPNRFTII